MNKRKKSSGAGAKHKASDLHAVKAGELQPRKQLKASDLQLVPKYQVPADATLTVAHPIDQDARLTKEVSGFAIRGPFSATKETPKGSGNGASRVARKVAGKCRIRPGPGPHRRGLADAAEADPPGHAGAGRQRTGRHTKLAPRFYAVTADRARESDVYGATDDYLGSMILQFFKVTM